VGNGLTSPDDQFMTYVNASTKQVVITFKGSSTLNDFISDLNPKNEGASDYQAIEAAAHQSFLDIEKEYPGYTIFTDGHSLGGGMAQTFALQFHLSGYGQNSLPIAASSFTTYNLPAVSTYTGAFSETNVTGDPATAFYAGDAYLNRNPTKLANPNGDIGEVGGLLADAAGNLIATTLGLPIGEAASAAIVFGFNARENHSIVTVANLLAGNPSAITTSVATLLQTDNSTIVADVNPSNPLVTSNPTLAISPKTEASNGVDYTVSTTTVSASETDYTVTGSDGTTSLFDVTSGPNGALTVAYTGKTASGSTQSAAATNNPDGTSSITVFSASAKSSDTINYGAANASGSSTSSAISIAAGDTFNATTNTVNETATFAGNTGSLLLTKPTSFTGTIDKFQTGDTIDLAGIAASSATLGANNLLTLSTGKTIQFDPKQSFSGYQFAAKSDGNGGTDLTLAAAPPPPPPKQKLITVTVTGVVEGGTDTSGVFGAANTSLTGDAFTAVITVDPSKGINTDPTTQRDTNGLPVESYLMGNQPGAISSVLTINGRSFTFNDTTTYLPAQRVSFANNSGTGGGSVSFSTAYEVSSPISEQDYFNIGINSGYDNAPWTNNHYDWETPYPTYTLTSDDTSVVNSSFNIGAFNVSPSVFKLAGGSLLIKTISESNGTPTPTPTVHTVTTSGQIGNTDGSTYNVTANTISESIIGTNTSPIFIQANNDTVTLTADTASYTVTDNGQGTTFAVPVFPAKGATITIKDFENDKTGVISLVDQFSTAQAAVAAIKSDGSGGSLLTLQGGLTLDFAGDTKITASNFQLHNL
jgi:hypothetical protein